MAATEFANYYKIQLRQFSSDSGFTNNARVLSARENDARRRELIDLARTGTNLDAVYRLNNELRFQNSVSEVIFDVSPTISESREAEYVDEALPGPIGIIVYARTSNRKFSVSSRFVSRNRQEAEINYLYTNLLRGWMIPQTNEDSVLRPPILRLNGYKNQFFNIPVVITSLSINYPEDVDYIETENAMVPIVQSVEVNLTESHAIGATATDRDGVNDTLEGEFDLEKFKQGILPGY
jgi:hypothetical protein